jgi:hypothetical protein
MFREHTFIFGIVATHCPPTGDDVPQMCEIRMILNLVLFMQGI